MWYLLVAAGAGYLAQRWQNAQKARPTCGQNGRTSPITSPPTTPKRELYSPLSKSMPNISNIVHDASSGLNSLLQNASSGSIGILLDKDISSFRDISSSPPQEIESNKRSTCAALLANPVRVETEGQLGFTLKGSLTVSANVDNKEEQQLKEDLSSSPSSCCSSNSTVINSPIDSHPILQRFDGSLQYQGQEQSNQVIQQSGFFHFQGKEQKKQLNVSQNQSASLNTKLEGESLGHVFPTTQSQYADALQDAGCGNCEDRLLDDTAVAPKFDINAAVSSIAATVTDDSTMLDAGIHTPLSITGKRQRDNTRTDFLHNDLTYTDISKSDKEQSSAQMITRKIRSQLSPCYSRPQERASENKSNVESDAFVSFGLAMAVCVMVSSGKNEMEKMGKVLRETEDLVSDMRKELEERRIRSCIGEEDNDEFFTIKTEDAVGHDCATEKGVNHMDAFCKSGLCDDDWSVRSCATGGTVENQLDKCHVVDECGVKSYCVEANAGKHGNQRGRGASNVKLQSIYYDSEEESDSEEGEDDHVMSMIELERKLWNVFQQRQEERISELEDALELALSKLHAKEEELRWWKNRASWLMEQSFGSRSDGLKTKNQVKRVEGFECVEEEGLRETSSSTVEGRIIELVGPEGSSTCPDPAVKSSSTCSISCRGEPCIARCEDVRLSSRPMQKKEMKPPEVTLTKAYI